MRNVSARARPDVRLPEYRMPGEVAPLVRAVNEAFERLERGFIAQREFLADAAHELRTPLAILYAEAESLDDHEAARTLLADIESMTRIVNQLIDIAGLDSLTVKADDCADIQCGMFRSCLVHGSDRRCAGQEHRTQRCS